MRHDAFNPIMKIKILCLKGNKKLTCYVLLTKVEILFKFHKILCWCPLFVFIPYSGFHIVFSFIEQLQLHATNSDKLSFHICFVTKIF